MLNHVEKFPVRITASELILCSSQVRSGIWKMTETNGSSLCAVLLESILTMRRQWKRPLPNRPPSHEDQVDTWTSITHPSILLLKAGWVSALEKKLGNAIQTGRSSADYSASTKQSDLERDEAWRCDPSGLYMYSLLAMLTHDGKHLLVQVGDGDSRPSGLKTAMQSSRRHGSNFRITGTSRPQPRRSMSRLCTS